MSEAISEKRARPVLTVVVTHPIQYYAPLYRRLAARNRLDLHVTYLSDAGASIYVDPGFGREIAWDVPLLDGYDYTVLRPRLPLSDLGFWGRSDPGLADVLARTAPDWVLIYGYASRMNWATVRWARKAGARVAYTSDSNIHDPRSRAVQMIKRPLLRKFFASIDAFFAPSDSNVAYLRSFDAPDARIHHVPFAIDTARFRVGAPGPGAARPYDFLWAGKFIALKRPGDFVDALDRLARSTSRTIRACLVGDGPLDATLRQRANVLPENCELSFLGFVNQSAMPGVLQGADTLVFSSDREPYGLIATEAAAAGAALIVADNIGCVGQRSVARPGVNTLTYRVGDVAALAAQMQLLRDDREVLRRMQRASTEIAEQHDVEHAAAAIESVIMRGPFND